MFYRIVQTKSDEFQVELPAPMFGYNFLMSLEKFWVQ